MKDTILHEYIPQRIIQLHAYTVINYVISKKKWTSHLFSKIWYELLWFLPCDMWSSELCDLARSLFALLAAFLFVRLCFMLKVINRAKLNTRLISYNSVLNSRIYKLKDMRKCHTCQVEFCISPAYFEFDAPDSLVPVITLYTLVLGF